MSDGASATAPPPEWARVWHRHGPALVRTAAAALSALAVLWLAYEAWRFLWQPERLGSVAVHPGALDLKMRWAEIRDWFSGIPVYPDRRLAVYPPASYALLWPFLGWLPEREAIRFWAATTALALGGLAFLAVQQSGATRLRERWLLAVLPLSMYATGATLGNGQLTIHVVAALIAAIRLVERDPRGRGKDVLAAALFLFALVKPSVAAPFFWIVLFRPGRWRPAILVASGYLGLTLLAASFQPGGVPGLVDQWLGRSTDTAGNPHLVVIAVSLPTALAALGLGGWATPATLLLLAGLGGWLFRHRYSDLWLRLGVTAIAARFWTFHLWYDDLLFLLPMVTLFRLVRATDGSRHRPLVAGVLLALLVITNLAPGGLYLLPAPWRHVYVGLQVTVWLAVLVFLLHVVRGRARGRVPSAAGAVVGEGTTTVPRSPDVPHAG